MRPFMPKSLAIILLFALIAALFLVPAMLGRYQLYMLSLWAVTAIAAMGLNLTLGYAGQVSLAQGAFVGIGSYTLAILTVTLGLPFLPALIAAALAAFVIGWLLGYPALRVQHHYLAFVTLAFATFAYLVFRNEEWLTGGTYGIIGVTRPEFFGWSSKSPLNYYYLCLVGLGLVALGFYGMIRSPWGRSFIALRENPTRAMSLGVDTRRYTLMAFAIGSAMGGISGALYGPLVEFVDPSSFTMVFSLNLLMMVIIGGSGFFFGPLLGAAIAVLLPEVLRFSEHYYLILYTLAVIVMMIYSPTGLLGILDKWIANRRSRTASDARKALSDKVETGSVPS